jgi:ligand-binding sensor domain-containing protein/two-component sensor histidine kinase
MRFVFFFSLMVVVINLPAQNPFIRHYTTSDGLPSNVVYYVFQDSKRFIWFATDAGVARYDGTIFTNYRKKDGLSSNEVIRIREDSFGRIWFFNLNGRLDYFFQNKIFNHTNTPFLDALKNKNFFLSFYQDKDSVIYFYNWQFEIFVLSAQNKVKHIDIIGESFGDQKNRIPGKLNLRYMEKNSSGEFILWTQHAIFKMSPLFTNQVRIFDSVNICSVFPNRNKSYYLFAYENGVIRWDDKNQPDTVPMPFKMFVGYRLITSILEDAGGFLWIVTFDHGVFCLKNNKVIRHFDISQGQAVIQDHENNIWISSMKDGIYKISPYLANLRYYGNAFFQNKGITALHAKPGYGLWLTNGKTIYLKRDNDFYSLDLHDENTTLNMMCQVGNNKLFAGERGLKMYLFDGIDLVHENRQLRFRHAINNYMYLNAKTTGYIIDFKKIVINRTGDKIFSFHDAFMFRTYIYSPFEDARSINIGEHVFNIFYNVNDDLIINAKRNYRFRNDRVLPCNELSRFDGKIITDHLILNPFVELYNIDGDSLYLYDQHNFFNLTAAFDPPIDLQIRKIAYHEPELYLATARNVYRSGNPLNLIEHKPVRLYLLNINFSNIQDILVFKDSLHIASEDGLTIIPEALIRKMKTSTPTPYLQSILVNEKEMFPMARELHLTGNKKITFNFSSIEYSSTPFRYAYKMDGVDSVWTTGIARSVVYQNLPRGNYVFRLRVNLPGAALSAPVECRVEIRAVFWQHPLFIWGMSTIFMGFLILFIIRRKNLQIRKRELDHQLITLEQKALQSMMNPHFIFNSLGSIQTYILQKKSLEAGMYLSQFARLIRQNLNAINAANITLEEEAERLRNYLDLEKLRMENKFEYHIEMDESLAADEILIPSMIVQPFVENAIWHGISPLEEKGEISVGFRKIDEKSLKIIIVDNGIGMQKSRVFSTKSEKHFHLGMEMTRRRLELLGKKYAIDTSIECFEVSPGYPNPGTKVVLVLPISS